jgi:hypothetical protein
MAVTAKDKARWRAIGEALEELNREALAGDAVRSPGENIVRGLELSDSARQIARAFAAPREEKDKPSMVALWRARKAYRG